MLACKVLRNYVAKKKQSNLIHLIILSNYFTMDYFIQLIHIVVCVSPITAWSHSDKLKVVYETFYILLWHFCKKKIIILQIPKWLSSGSITSLLLLFNFSIYVLLSAKLCNCIYVIGTIRKNKMVSYDQEEMTIYIYNFL